MRLPGFVRRAAGALIGKARVRIRAGPNRGRWWSLASAGRGAAAGSFEARRVDGLLRLLRMGDVVWDIGAHKGYVALAASRAVGRDGRVYAIEPAPDNLRFLQRHVAWNDAANIEVVATAVSDRDGRAQFGGSGSSITYRLDHGDDEVEVRTLPTLLADGLMRPTVLKIDVEGSEGAVLRGAGAALAEIDLVLVAVHTRDMYDECSSLLAEHGFTVHRSAAMQRMMDRLPDGWSADPDLLGVAPRRAVEDSDLMFFTGDN